MYIYTYIYMSIPCTRPLTARSRPTPRAPACSGPLSLHPVFSSQCEFYTEMFLLSGLAETHVTIRVYALCCTEGFVRYAARLQD